MTGRRPARAPPDTPAARAIAREPGARLRGGVGAAVVGGRDLDVFHVAPAVRPLVFDPDVRELHPVVIHGEAVFVRPLLNLLLCPVGAAVAIGAVTVPLLEKALIFALQLGLEDDPLDARAFLPETFGAPHVRAVQMGVVGQFARSDEQRTEGDGGAVVPEERHLVGGQDGQLAGQPGGQQEHRQGGQKGGVLDHRRASSKAWSTRK